VAAGDNKPEIRDAGLRGLGLAPGGGFGTARSVGSGGGGGEVGAGGNGAQVLSKLYPTPKVRCSAVWGCEGLCVCVCVCVCEE